MSAQNSRYFSFSSASLEISDKLFLKLAKILSKTDLEDYESLQYFQNALQSSGIINALIERGIGEGDTVSIYDLEFDYVP